MLFRSVTWSSSAPAVAEVNASGKVTAKAAGTASVTVTTVDGGYTALCAVTVTAAPSEGGALGLSKTAVLHGESFTVSFKQPTALTVASISLGVAFDNAAFEVTDMINGANASGKVSIGYTDPTYDANTAVAAGTELLRFTLRVKDGAAAGEHAVSLAEFFLEGAYDPVLYANVDITPTDAELGAKTLGVTVLSGSYVAVTGVTLNKTTLDLNEGESAALAATVAPAAATDKSVSWSSSAPAVAEVDAAGKVTAKAAGTATITVTTAEGGFTASCTVTVVHIPAPHTPGDVNGDGKVNNRDAIALFRWLGGEPVSVVSEALDTDGNGTVNLADAAFLFACLSGSGGTLH